MKQLLIIVLLFFCFIANAQVKSSTDPKVGLVLSGGGAKGLAHIGTLKVIDSLGVRVDYVAGTSMGAIIGALYASGYSGKQIDSIFGTINFDRILNDIIPREAKTYYERETSERYAVTLPFDNFKLDFPTALSRGQNTFNLFSRLLQNVVNVNDFSKLPIPYFCMATDIETGKQVLLDDGNLPQAVKASSSIPTLFQPEIIDGKILVDGGVVNNYPVDELRAKGMDIIIGVDVQDGLANRESMSSALDILSQINNFRTIEDMVKKSKKTDIYIKPDIKDYSLLSFSDGIKIIKNGEIAANSNTGVLQTLANLQKKKPKKHIVHQPADSLKVNSITVLGNEKYTRSYILGKLKLKPFTETTYEKLNKGFNNLVGTNNFDSFLYQLIPSKENEGYNVITKVVESNNNMFLKFGLHYDDVYKAGLLGNFTRKQLLRKNDILSLDLVLGDNLRYNFDYFVDQGFHWSFGVNARFNQFERNVPASLLYDNVDDNAQVNKINLIVQDYTNQLYVRTLLGNDLSLSIGGEHKFYSLGTETLISGNNKAKTIFDNRDLFSGFARLKFDSYNNKYFPTGGVFFDAIFQNYFYSVSKYETAFSSFSVAKANVGYAIDFFKHFSLNTTGSVGFKINPERYRYLDFILGGYGNNFINNYEPFYGYDYLSLRSDSFLKVGAILDYKFYNKHHVNFAANFANIKDGLFTSGEFVAKPNHTGYALGYSIETVIGPAQIKYSFSPENTDTQIFISIGFWF